MTGEMEKSKENEGEKEKECFVIMPISDPQSYESGHFKMVYDDIFKPAIKAAGFKPHRVDDSKASHMIQIEIVRKIIEAPMAICDLSTRNPNVLFELGIRQAFDKPVVLLQEKGTDRIFDISSINTIDYRKECIYSEVLKDQEIIREAIEATYSNHIKGECINSLIKLIGIEPAKLGSSGEMKDNEMLKLIFNEVMDLKHNINSREIGIDKVAIRTRPVRNNRNTIVSLLFKEEFSDDTKKIIKHEFLGMSPIKMQIVDLYWDRFTLRLEVKHSCPASELSSVVSKIFNMITLNLGIKEPRYEIATEFNL